MQPSSLRQTIKEIFSPIILVGDFPTLSRVVGRVATTLILVVLGSTMLGRAESFAVSLPQEPAQTQQLQTQQPAPAAEAPQQSAAELQKLVAPIALYPDSLVAQILAASTYPTQVVEAQRWLQKHSNLQGEQLAKEVDQQSWDPSVKALTQFPSVLANLDKNLSWMSALGDAYYSQQQDVLDAVQVMRRRAEDAGNLRTTEQQRVVNQGPTIIIEPVERDYWYLPVYDPWLVYGARLAPYPGYYYDPWFGPSFISWGPRIHLGFFFGFGWGWNNWGCNWGSRFLVFNRNPYHSRGHNFSRHVAFTGGGRGGFDRGGQFNNRNGSDRGLGAPGHDRGPGFTNRNVDRGAGFTNRSVDRGAGFANRNVDRRASQPTRNSEPGRSGVVRQAPPVQTRPTTYIGGESRSIARPGGFGGSRPAGAERSSTARAPVTFGGGGGRSSGERSSGGRTFGGSSSSPRGSSGGGSSRGSGGGGGGSRGGGSGRHR